MVESVPSTEWVHDLLAESRFRALRIARVEEGSGSLASFDVDDRYVLRIALSEEARAGLSREIAVLDVVRRGTPVPVPTYVSVGEREGLTWGIYPKLRGVSAREPPPVPGAHPALAKVLGGLLRHVHGLKPPDEIPIGEPDVPWRGRLEDLPRLARVLESSAVVELNDMMRRFLQADVAAPPGPRRLVLCHGDIKGEHILLSEDRRMIVGVIDWNDAVVGDPAIDIAGAIIWLGPRFGRSVVAVLDDADDDVFSRALFLARVGMLWGLGRTLIGEDDWPIDLATRLVRTAFS